MPYTEGQEKRSGSLRIAHTAPGGLSSVSRTEAGGSLCLGSGHCCRDEHSPSQAPSVPARRVLLPPDVRPAHGFTAGSCDGRPSGGRGLADGPALSDGGRGGRTLAGLTVKGLLGLGGGGLADVRSAHGFTGGSCDGRAAGGRTLADGPALSDGGLDGRTLAGLRVKGLLGLGGGGPHVREFGSQTVDVHDRVVRQSRPALGRRRKRLVGALMADGFIAVPLRVSDLWWSLCSHPVVAGGDSARGG